MHPGVLRKILLAALWITPTIGLVAFTTEQFAFKLAPPPAPEIQTPLKLPIEVITRDSNVSKIVYVEIDASTVPEPSTALLLPLSALLLFRRKR